jgi:hypothetical protein
MGQGEVTVKSRETPCDLGGTNFWIQWPWISCAGTKAEAAQRGRAEDGGLRADEMRQWSVFHAAQVSMTGTEYLEYMPTLTNLGGCRCSLFSPLPAGPSPGLLPACFSESPLWKR